MENKMEKKVKDLLNDVKEELDCEKEEAVRGLLKSLLTEIENVENLLNKMKDQYNKITEKTVSEVYYQDIGVE